MHVFAEGCTEAPCFDFLLLYYATATYARDVQVNVRVYAAGGVSKLHIVSSLYMFLWP